jgi:hypothetical protein
MPSLRECRVRLDSRGPRETEKNFSTTCPGRSADAWTPNLRAESYGIRTMTMAYPSLKIGDAQTPLDLEFTYLPEPMRSRCAGGLLW